MSSPEGRRRKAAYFPFVFQRLAVHHEQPHVALGRFGQVLLGDDVAVAADGFNHLVQIAQVVLADQKNPLASGALQRLNDDVSAQVAGEGSNFAAVAGDERRRADFLGKELEVHLVDGLGQAVGIVQHDHAPQHGGPAEHDAGDLGPATPAGVLGRVVAEHQDVEVVDGDAVGAGSGPAKLVEVGSQDFVLFLGGRAGSGAGVVVGVEREVAGADQPGLVTAIDGRHRQPRGCVGGLFRFQGINDKADTHERK